MFTPSFIYYSLRINYYNIYRKRNRFSIIFKLFQVIPKISPFNH